MLLSKSSQTRIFGQCQFMEVWIICLQHSNINTDIPPYVFLYKSPYSPELSKYARLSSTHTTIYLPILQREQARTRRGAIETMTNYGLSRTTSERMFLRLLEWWTSRRNLVIHLDEFVGSPLRKTSHTVLLLVLRHC